MRHPSRLVFGRLATVAVATAAVAGLVPAGPAGAATAMVWNTTINDHPCCASGQAIVVSPAGSTVYAAGVAATDEDSVGELAAYSSATGATVWHTQFSAGTDWTSGFTSIAVSPSGSTVFVTGYSGQNAGALDQVVVAYNAATGAKLWQATGPVWSGSAGAPLTVAPDGSTVFVTNGTADPPETEAYDAATGTGLWTSPFGGKSIALAPGGTALFLTGVPGVDPTVALDAATGTRMWGTGYAAGTRLTSTALSADGLTLFVAGTTPDKGHGPVFVVVAYSASNGTQLWAAQTGGAGPGGAVAGLAASPDGSAVVVSETFIRARNAAAHWITLGLNPSTGATLWTRTLRGRTSTDGGAWASALTVSGPTAYVTGYAYGTGTAGRSHDVTVGYTAATGATVFSAEYRGWQNDYAHAVAVSPDGSMVFVTGAREYTAGTEHVGWAVMTTVGCNT